MLPPIQCVLSRVMLIDHTYPETARTAMTEHQSHTNPQEAVLTCPIVSYLLDQGYKCSNIVVLTPYLGQLLETQQQRKLTCSANARIEREAMDDLQSAGEHVEEEHFDFLYGSDERRAVRISTIDNFRAEEADIVCFSSCATTTKARLAS
jgi:superfamily I DNA and/or RNA helicase